MHEGLSTTVESSLGKVSIDSSGAPIGVVRMPPELFLQIPALLQRYINDADQAAWDSIKGKIDYAYESLESALAPLSNATNFGKKVKAQVKEGKKVLFKPNLVNPVCIDPITHGEGMGSPACTQWPFMAALVRWFHDRLEISYHSMAVGEAGTTISNVSRLFGLIVKAGQPFPTEAVFEGRYKNFYGGWGFYFARKYLYEAHPRGHSDDPMSGYE